MNKIININIAGRLIPIDEKAYEHLSIYINKLKQHFSAESGGDEIIRDMEDRIGELFQDKLNKGLSCIMQEDIDQMIEIMGSPEQIEHETGTDSNAPNTKEAKVTSTGQTNGGRTRLSRNGKDKVIGGVCSGIANYLNIDPVIVRVAMVLITLAWGSGILIYLLLWALLPETDAYASTLKRRLYRNPDQKIVGGVCSGLAAYLNLDPIIPRIVFVAPLLGMIFFGIIDSDIFFFPMIIGSFPTLLLLYVILWAVVPKANSITEKLEMRGERIDVQNLSQAMKSDSNEITQKKNPALGDFFVIMAKIFIFFILTSVLIALAGTIIGLLVAILGLAGSTEYFYPISSLIIENPTHRVMLIVFLALSLIIPFYLIIRVLIFVLTGKKQKRNSLIYGTSIALFIISIFGLTWIIARIASDFKTEYTQTYQQPLAQPNTDTLTVKQLPFSNNGLKADVNWNNEDFELENLDFFQFKDDTTIAISNISLHFAQSPDSNFHFNIQKSARGRNLKRAEGLATPLNLAYSQQGSVLTLPSGFDLPSGQPFRMQKINLEVQIPVGKYFRTEDVNRNIYANKTFKIRKRAITVEDDDFPVMQNDHIYKMTANGVVDLLAPAKTDATDSTNVVEL